MMVDVHQTSLRVPLGVHGAIFALNERVNREPDQLKKPKNEWMIVFMAAGSHICAQKEVGLPLLVHACGVLVVHACYHHVR